MVLDCFFDICDSFCQSFDQLIVFFIVKSFFCGEEYGTFIELIRNAGSTTLLEAFGETTH